VPMQVRRSGELQIQDSSSVSLAGHRRSAPLNRIGQRKSIKVISEEEAVRPTRLLKI
jgi:hypothetical protein